MFTTSLETVFKKRLLPLSTLYTGTEYTSEIPIPQGLQFYKYSMARGGWTDTGSDVVSVMIEISLDGGLTWPVVRGFTARGGNLVNKTGQILPYSGIRFELPEIDNPNRKVRVKRNVFTNLTTSDEIEII